MRRIKKFAVVLLTLVCAVGLLVFIAGCNEEEASHTHTYSEDWTCTSTSHWRKATCEHASLVKDKGEHTDSDSDGLCDVCGYELEHIHKFNEDIWMSDNESHWHAATCEHTDEKGSLAAHVDENEDGVCDICETKHNHTYSSVWSKDENEHWHGATCSHTTLREDVGSHVDANNDELCDVCGASTPHQHTFDESTFIFDENQHWYAATCRHSNVKGEPANHTFENGECACGVKKSDSDVYKALIELEMTDSAFVDWLDEIEEQGVSYRLTAAGDIIRADAGGDEEVMYYAERTIKVNCVTRQGTTNNFEPIADVYVKVVCAINGVDQYYADGTTQEKSTNALAIGVSDENGIAEVKFTPQLGFSSDTVTYRVQIPEAKDIAALLGIDEEVAYNVPNRYIYDDDNNIFEVEVDGDTDLSDPVATMTVEFSGSWGAYHTLYLPYHRYFRDPINGLGIAESKEKTLTFTSSGNRYYDYIVFEPYYIAPGFAPYDHPGEDSNKIIDNSRTAASSVYKISFEINGDGGNPVLVSYNAPESDAAAGNYTTSSISGGTADEKHTGGDFVYVTVQKEFATKQFQFGFVSDRPCEVTLKVEWQYEVGKEVDYTFNWADAQDDVFEANDITLKGYGTTRIALNNFNKSGIYKISVGGIGSSGDMPYGKFSVYTDDDMTNNFVMYDFLTPNGVTSLFGTAQYAGYVRINSQTKILNIYNGVSVETHDIKIEPAVLPTVKEGLGSYPTTCTNITPFELRVDPSLEEGEYNLTFQVRARDDRYRINVYVNSEMYTFWLKSTHTSESNYVGPTLKLKGGDIIKFVSTNSNPHMLRHFNVYAILTKAEIENP